MSIFVSFMRGLSVCGGLIIGIGAQNAFVLKQGASRNYVFVTAMICILIDALLITLGVNGFGLALSANTILMPIVKWGGILFLCFYACLALKAMMDNEGLVLNDNDRSRNLTIVVLGLLSVSLLNPHVYLDTMVLIGSIGAQHQGQERLFFTLGAVMASCVWFFALAYGSQKCARFFAKPIVWKILNGLIALMMFAIAASLLVLH